MYLMHCAAGLKTEGNMESFKGLCWAATVGMLACGTFAVVAFEPQYKAAGGVLLIGAVVFLGMAILADKMGAR